MTALSGAVDSGDKTRYPAVLRSGRPTGLPTRNTAAPSPTPRPGTPACLEWAVAKGAANEEPEYLALQVFTGSPNPNTAFGADPVQGEIPSEKSLSDFARDLITRIGTTGQRQPGATRRLALIFGPLSFDHSDALTR